MSGRPNAAGASGLGSRFVERFLASVERQSPSIFSAEGPGEGGIEGGEAVLGALRGLLPQWVRVMEGMVRARQRRPRPRAEGRGGAREEVALAAAAAHRAEGLFAWPHLAFIPAAWRAERARADLHATAALETLAGSLIPALRERAAAAAPKTWLLWDTLAGIAALSMLHASWANLFLLYDTYAADITTTAEGESVLRPIERFHTALKAALQQLKNEKGTETGTGPTRGDSDADFELSCGKFDLAIRRVLFPDYFGCLGGAAAGEENRLPGEHGEGSKTPGEAPQDGGEEGVGSGFAKSERGGGERPAARTLASASVVANLWFAECCRVAARDDARSFASDRVPLRVVERLLGFLVQRTCEEAADRASGSRQPVPEPRPLRVGVLAAVTLDSPLTPAAMAKKSGGLVQEPTQARTLGRPRGDGKRNARKNRRMAAKPMPRRKRRRSVSSDATSRTATDSTGVGSSADDSDGTPDEEEYSGRSDLSLDDAPGRGEDLFVGGAGARRRAQRGLVHRRPCQARLAGVALTTGSKTDGFGGLRLEDERHARGGTLQWLAPCSSNTTGIASLARLG